MGQAIESAASGSSGRESTPGGLEYADLRTPQHPSEGSIGRAECHGGVPNV